MPTTASDGSAPTTYTPLTRSVIGIGLPAAFAGLLYASPPTAALTPILISPTVLAAYYRSRQPAVEAGDFNRAVRVYSFNAILGPLLSAAIQWAFGLGLAKLVFDQHSGSYLEEFQRSSLAGLSADVLDTRKTMAHDARYIFWLAVCSYLFAGVVEEGMKYLSLRLALLRSPAKHEKNYLVYAVAAGIGFATLENIGFVYAAISSGEVVSKVALTVVERTIFGILGHGATAALIALRSVQRDSRSEKASIWHVFAKAAWYHGTFDFMLFVIAAFNGNVGWIRPTDLWSNVVMYTLSIGLHGSLWVELWNEIKRLNLGLCK